MSIHKSLHTGGALVKHRNVLTRAERIKVLEEAGRWREEKDSAWGLRKVKNIKTAAKKKAAAKKEAAAPAAPGAAAPGAPAAAAPAGEAKPAAPGAKAAAPAAKKEAGKK
ncbi:MAG: small basic protein [Planctomycetota bacterium]